MKRRAVIVADSALAATALGRALREVAALEVLGWVDASAPCEAKLAATRADVVVIDGSGVREGSLARIAEARRAAGDARVVLISTVMDPAWLAQASRSGADAAIRRTADPYRVAGLIRDVIEGRVYQSFAAAVAPAEQLGDATGLTGRELQILRLVAAGEPNSAIAARLCITEQTVKFHLSNVYRKLGVANRTQASRYAHVNGLIDRAPAPEPVSVAA